MNLVEEITATWVCSACLVQVTDRRVKASDARSTTDASRVLDVQELTPPEGWMRVYVGGQPLSFLPASPTPPWIVDVELCPACVAAVKAAVGAVLFSGSSTEGTKPVVGQVSGGVAQARRSF